MSARDTVEIGLNRFARRGYDLDEVSIVPSRRTRDVDDVSTAWQIDAFRFDIPLVLRTSTLRYLQGDHSDLQANWVPRPTIVIRTLLPSSGSGAPPS